MSDPPTPPRRFAPEPIETTIKTRRRFVPEPVETTSKSNRGKPTKSPPRDKPTQSRFKPQPIEMSTKSNRNKPLAESAETLSEKPSSKSPPVEDTKKSSRRKFAPQLLETTKRSRRSGDAAPTELQIGDKSIPSEKSATTLTADKTRRPGSSPIPPINTPNSSSADGHRLLEPHRQPSIRPRNNTRQHSFLAPSLETIASSESEPSGISNCPSLSTSPSPSSEGCLDLCKNSSRTRESCDDRFSGYLLALAARAAEKQLKDQAMSAYANDENHEPVDHFGMDRNSEGSGEEMDRTVTREEDGDVKMRRDSSSELGWEFQEMQRHKEELDRQRESQWLEQAKKRRSSYKAPLIIADGSSMQSVHVSDVFGAPRHTIDDWQRDVGLECMRSAANPPMLGGDLAFPVCASPRHTKLNIDQHPFPRPGSQSSNSPASPGLWNAAECPTHRSDGAGLWMGCCVGAGDDTTPISPAMPTGLKTPADTGDVNMEENADIEHLGSKFLTSEEISAEFPDAFVTQVYNYLSLGYPSLARRFDDELAKITRIPCDELRSDDKNADAKGFVGLGEGCGVYAKDVEGEGGKCPRWRALKVYVREWARCYGRKGGVEARVGVDGWGERIRRGSWAL